MQRFPFGAQRSIDGAASSCLIGGQVQLPLNPAFGYCAIRTGRILRHSGEMTAKPRRSPVPTTRDNGALPRHS